MYFSHPQIVLQEVPGEISLALSISGCPLACQGCHSAFTWSPTYGEELTVARFDQLLSRYHGLASCVLFYGGEWDPTLGERFSQARLRGYRLCLYSGLEMHELAPGLIRQLDYLKTGRWVRELGGLDSPATNQRFYRRSGASWDDMTHHFTRN